MSSQPKRTFRALGVERKIGAAECFQDIDYFMVLHSLDIGFVGAKRMGPTCRTMSHAPLRTSACTKGTDDLSCPLVWVIPEVGIVWVTRTAVDATNLPL